MNGRNDIESRQGPCDEKPSSTRTGLDIRRRQDEWLRELQAVVPHRPLLVQFTLPRKGVEWAGWNRDTAVLRAWLPVGTPRVPSYPLSTMTKRELDALTIGPYATRSILANEMVLDFDIEDRAVLMEEVRRAMLYVKRLGWRSYPCPTGGRGVHLHFFLSPTWEGTEPAVFDRVREYNAAHPDGGIDVWCFIRLWLLGHIIASAGLRTDGVDRKKVGWSRRNKGSQIRLIGCVRESGLTKTLDPRGVEVVFPSGPPVLNDLGLFIESIAAGLEEELRRRTNRLGISPVCDDRYVVLAWELAGRGAPEGERHDRALKLCTLLRAAEVPYEQARAVLRVFADHCPEPEQTIRNEEGTLRSVYNGPADLALAENLFHWFAHRLEERTEEGTI